MTDFVLALTTLPMDFDATALAEHLVTSRVAACVNVLPAVTSVYIWKDEVQHDREQQLVIKTSRDRVPALWTELRAKHPYETPEFVVIPIADGSDGYLAWLKAGTRSMS